MGFRYRGMGCGGIYALAISERERECECECECADCGYEEFTNDLCDATVFVINESSFRRTISEYRTNTELSDRYRYEEEEENE